MTMKRLLPLCLIGLAVFVFAAFIARAWQYQANLAQITASDWVMVKADGLRLGRRPPRDDISLVLFDVKTAAKLGYVRSYADDLRLYRQLFKAGARVVYDSRSTAAADDATFEEVKPLLDGMLEIRSDGALARDIYLGATILENTHPQYTNLAAPNLVNAHPHAIPWMRSRYYPMFQLTSVGPRESAPLAIVRLAWNAEGGDAESVGNLMRQCGVMTEWHRQAPDLVPENDVPQSPYPVGDRSIIWYPFLTSTILVPPAAFWISYDPAVSEYQRKSYIDVLEDSDTIRFDNQIVIIGFSPETDISSDSYEAPSAAGRAAPAEVMAAAVQTLLDERPMRVPPSGVRYLLLALICITFALVGGWFRPVQAVWVTFAVLLAYFCSAVIAYRSGWYSDFSIVPAAGISSAMLGMVYSSWLSVRARHRVVDLFGRYVPRAVVNQLMLQPDLRSLTLGGVKRDMSVMFADIRGFTTFSEDLAPEEVVRQLNSLLEIMVECTFEHEGTLDKFIGDAILVLFNAPLDQPDHVARAVRTATSIQKRLVDHPTGLAIGIGLHRGEAVVGNIGTQRRLEYTAIGSTVNIASRLCGVAEPGEVIISAAMMSELGDEFETEPLAPVTVKGIKAPLAAFRVRPRQAQPSSAPVNS